jgi:hypothetical protein
MTSRSVWILALTGLLLCLLAYIGRREIFARQERNRIYSTVALERRTRRLKQETPKSTMAHRRITLAKDKRRARTEDLLSELQKVSCLPDGNNHLIF